MLIQTSATWVVPLAQCERSGWYSKKLLFPQPKPTEQPFESQSPSPTPHGKESQYSLSNSEQCPLDKQYSQFEVSQSESVTQVFSAARIEQKGKIYNSML